MSELFYDAAPNATRVAPERPKARAYPAKPSEITLFGTCVMDLFFPEAGLDAIRCWSAKAFGCISRRSSPVAASRPGRPGT